MVFVVVVLFWVFLPLVVATTMVVVGANGGCFGFFAMGYGCYDGASGGERGWQKFQFVGFWWFQFVFFFFFFSSVVVAGCKGWWQWMWVLVGFTMWVCCIVDVFLFPAVVFVGF